jgi:hypothetical protein
MKHCSRDLTAVKIKSSSEEGPREITLGSAYLPYDDAEPPPTMELERLVTGCRTEGTHLVIGCAANSHHTSWGSTNINNRGEFLFNYIMANGLDIMNKGNRPTFVICNRQEVIDITIATFYAGNVIKNWHLTEEVSCSDHRYIRFTATGSNRSIEVYRNPCRTDWVSFRTDLWAVCLKMMDKINDFVDLETAAEQFQEAIISAYRENYPPTIRKNNRNIPWWTQDLAEEGGKFADYLKLPRSQGIGLTAKEL